MAKAKEPGGFGRSMRDFFKGLKATLSSRPFLKLGLATFLVFNGFILVSSFQSYVIIYYVFAGDQARGAEFAGYAGTLGAISTFGVIFFITWLQARNREAAGLLRLDGHLHGRVRNEVVRLRPRRPLG